MLTLGAGPRSGPATDPWTPPILLTVAARAEGVAEVVTAITDHLDWLTRTGVLEQRRAARAAAEVEAIAFGILRTRVGDLRGDARLDALAARVLGGDLDPYAAADLLVAGLSA
jgi:LAO/AO transport system kinase